jgi:hypothetical protein
MVCVNCGKEITEGNSTASNGNNFCGNLCRSSYEKGNNSYATPFSNKGNNNKNITSSKGNISAQSGFSIMTVVLGTVYFLIIYFLLCSIIGAVFGAIAGINDPTHAAEAGKNAGFIVVQQYNLAIMLFAFIITQLGTLGKWLPLMKKTFNHCS